jgi:DNA (cytosine-5)-methyltransferase 1
MDHPLVLSLFPGIGLLDMAFEMEGFCVVRGPDVLWGGDIHGVFAGVIGGPPCQMFSRLAVLFRSNGHVSKFGNLIPEFERCITEAAPTWFVMENVPAAPAPVVDGYLVRHQVVNNRWFVDVGQTGAEQNRTRRLSFGTADGRGLAFDVALFEHQAIATGVTSSDGGGVMRGRMPTIISGTGGMRLEQGKRAFAVTARHAGRPPWVAGAVSSAVAGANSKQYVYSLEDACELQGLPRDFTDDMPFRKDAKLKAVANGVPIPMGRAIARAVKRAMGYPTSEEAA